MSLLGLRGKLKQSLTTTQKIDVEGGGASQYDDAINICLPNCLSPALSIAIV